MPILVGIDGTDDYFFSSERRNANYDITFANSFVSKICRPARPGSPTIDRMYLRGPLGPGGGLGDAIEEGYRFILRQHERQRRMGVNEPILLTGYSRGAVGVVDIAIKLKTPPPSPPSLLGTPPPIQVTAMLLFDAIDMHMNVEANVIPNNVGPVLHVRRDERSRSRTTWGYAVERHILPHLYHEESFHCTHGGMGGVPWPVPTTIDNPRLLMPRQIPDESRRNEFIQEDYGGGTTVTYDQDARVSEDVWKYVQKFIRHHGFQ